MGPLVPMTKQPMMMGPFWACVPVEGGACIPGYVGAAPAWQRIPLFNELALIQEIWPGAVLSVCGLPRGAARVDLEMPGVLPVAAMVPDGYPQKRPFLTLVDRGGFSTNATFLAASRCLARAAREAKGHLVVFETMRCVSSMSLLRTVQEEESMHLCDLDRVDHEDALTCVDLCMRPPTPDSDESAGILSTISTVTDAAGELATTDPKQLCWHKCATLEVACDAEGAEGGLKEEQERGAEGNMEEEQGSLASFTGLAANPRRLWPVRATGTRDYAKNWPHVFDDESDTSSSESSSGDDNDSDSDGSTTAEVGLVCAELEKNIRQCSVRGSNFA